MSLAFHLLKSSNFDPIVFAIFILQIRETTAQLVKLSMCDARARSIEIQNSTAEELQNTIGKLKSDIESLSRADVIAEKARNDLKMVFTHPETLRIEIDPTLEASL